MRARRAGGAARAAQRLAVPLAATCSRVGHGRSLTGLQRDAAEPDNPSNDPWPIDHHFNYKPYQPWTTDAAYQHTLVTGNDGELATTDFTRAASDKAGLAEEIVRTRATGVARRARRQDAEARSSTPTAG